MTARCPKRRNSRPSHQSLRAVGRPLALRGQEGGRQIECWRRAPIWATQANKAAFVGPLCSEGARKRRKAKLRPTKESNAAALLPASVARKAHQIATNYTRAST